MITKQTLPVSVQESVQQKLDCKPVKAVCGPCFGVGEGSD